MIGRLPVIGVMGSGEEPHRDLASVLGRWLAGQGVHLLTGGGGGVMAAVSEAFASVVDRKGLVIGVLPAADDEVSAPAGYPNPYVEIVLRTHLAARGEDGADFDSRNHINVLSSDALVLLPGGAGTRSEALLAQRYAVPAMVWDPRGVKRALARSKLPHAKSFADVQAFVRRVIDSESGGF
ncbi:MAG: molybdenum cofactor carrier protein [Gammaproteobacteria bacterium]